jgi:hypothetical protein
MVQIPVGLKTLLATIVDRTLRTREIRRAIGVSEQEQGLPPPSCWELGQYQRLRRLKSACAALICAHSAAIADPAVQRHGFSDVHRFVMAYWKAYGEIPPTAESLVSR